MKFIEKLERKYGRYGIPNLTKYMIGCYVLGYLLMRINPAILSMMSLDVSKILQGQVWRLVTWVIYPPSNSSIFFFVIAIFFFYYPIGMAMERTWESFRYTLYVFSGLIFTIIGAFILHFITGGFVELGGYVYALGGSIFSTYYVSMSILLAYAFSYPDMQILLWFVIPIKMKWMAYVYIAMIVYDCFSYFRGGMWFMVVPIVSSLLNFVIFYFGTRDMYRYNPKEIHRKQQFKKAMAQSRAYSEGRVTKHKCAICGRTEQDDPNLEFRFCSKCEGNYEYCQDHLFTHTHVK